MVHLVQVIKYLNLNIISCSNHFENLSSNIFKIVSKAKNKETGDIVAIKKIKKKIHCWEGCTALREINSLRNISHPNVVKITELIRESDSFVYLVFEYMDDGNLYEFMKFNSKISEGDIKGIVKQIFLALDYMHGKGYFHRDIKPENILLRGNVCKLADFGLAREIRSLPPYTDYISTRWYRAPEVLLRSPTYNSPVDTFAVGCIIAELYTYKPLFPGNSEIDQIHKIITVLGVPTKESWPEGLMLASRMNYNFPDTSNSSDNRITLDKIVPQAYGDALDLIKGLLKLNPKERLNASEALNHSYFNNNQDRNYNFSINVNDMKSGVNIDINASHSSSPERGMKFHNNWNSYSKSNSMQESNKKRNWSQSSNKPSTSSTNFDNVAKYNYQHHQLLPSTSQSFGKIHSNRKLNTSLKTSSRIIASSSGSKKSFHDFNFMDDNTGTTSKKDNYHGINNNTTMKYKSYQMPNFSTSSPTKSIANNPFELFNNNTSSSHRPATSNKGLSITGSRAISKNNSGFILGNPVNNSITNNNSFRHKMNTSSSTSTSNIFDAIGQYGSSRNNRNNNSILPNTDNNRFTHHRAVKSSSTANIFNTNSHTGNRKNNNKQQSSKNNFAHLENYF